MQAQTKECNGFRFSNDWFTTTLASRGRGTRESTRQLYERTMLPMARQFRTILELGICEGRSAMWIWDNIRPDLWVGVDPWFPDRLRHNPLYATWRQNFWHNVEIAGAENLTVPEDVGGRITTEFRYATTRCLMAEWPSAEYLKYPVGVDLPKQQFDLCIVDADHHGAEAMTDMVLCWPLLKRGGIMIIDDYNRRWLHGRAHVREAATGFCMAFEERIEKILEEPRQLWLRKRYDV